MSTKNKGVADLGPICNKLHIFNKLQMSNIYVCIEEIYMLLFSLLLLLLSVVVITSDPYTFVSCVPSRFLIPFS